MIGYFKKDLFLLRRQLRSYGIILLIYGVISVTGIWGPWIVPAFVSVVTLMCPLTAFAYDQMCRWDAYARSLPDGGRKAVQGRYLCVAVIAVGAAAVCSLFTLALWGLGLTDLALPELLAGNLSSGVVGVLMTALILPLCYKFGVERARVLMLVTGIVVVAGFTGVAALGENLPSPSGPALAAVCGAAAVLILALFLLSYHISQRIYQKKEL